MKLRFPRWQFQSSLAPLSAASAAAAATSFFASAQVCLLPSHHCSLMLPRRRYYHHPNKANIAKAGWLLDGIIFQPHIVPKRVWVG
jgi:hypothetical protein